MKIHNFSQGTPEWYEIRRWKMTGSKATAIGNSWKWLDTYIDDLMAEYFSKWEKEHYSNEHTERWHEREPQARWLYELETWNIVEEVWFVEYNEFLWCSPDGIVSNDGLVEIKSPDDKKHFRMIMNREKEIDSDYRWQMQFNLWITDRKWCDFISYNPNYEESLIIFRIHRDEEMIKKLQDWALYWINKIRKIKEMIEVKK